MTNNKIMGYNKELQNLMKADISGGTWIDAGCGQGAYTIPLSSIVDSVLAIDQNSSNLRSLQNKLIRLHITNITTKQADFKDLNLYESGVFNNILFTFSLHYTRDISFIQDMLRLKKDQSEFKIIIIEYTRTTPVPWVPFPCPLEKIAQLVAESEDYKIENKYQNNRYYIAEIRNKSII